MRKLLTGNTFISMSYHLSEKNVFCSNCPKISAIFKVINLLHQRSNHGIAFEAAGLFGTNLQFNSILGIGPDSSLPTRRYCVYDSIFHHKLHPYTMRYVQYVFCVTIVNLLA